MSGIEISEEVTQSQLEAVCGGPVLLAEAGFFTPIRYTSPLSRPTIGVWRVSSLLSSEMSFSFFNF